jgi:hypothetical protein
VARRLSVNELGERFLVERIGLDYPITFVMPSLVDVYGEEGIVVSMGREALQADIDDRVVPPIVEVTHSFYSENDGWTDRSASQSQVEYLATCSREDLGNNHPGVSELLAFAGIEAQVT